MPAPKDPIAKEIWKKRLSLVWRGRKHTEATKKKMSIIQKIVQSNLVRKPISQELRHKLGSANRGKHLSEETKTKIANARRLTNGMRNRKGDKHPNWKGGITPINLLIRNSTEYKQWRKSVFERDNYTCVLCGQKGGILNADHIKSFAQYPDLRIKLDNGRTLCKACHEKTPNFKGRKNKIKASSQA